jgi:uncharacterized protein
MMIKSVILAAAAFLVAAAPAPTASSNPVKEGVEAWGRGDYSNAVKAWRPAAIAGDADAQFNMGQAYKLGRGVSADLLAAEDWYRKSAQQGHLQAEDNLGLVMFQNGKRQEAMPLLQKSANRGEPRAQYIYGTALFNGDLVNKDWVRAYAFMTRASAAGLAPASSSLGQMDQHIPIDQRQKGQALARELEAAAAKPVIASPTLPVRPVSRPPQSTGPVARPVDIPPAATGPEDEPDQPPVERPVVPPAAPRPQPKPAVVGKGWRVQLGAFGDPSKARSLFSSLKSSIPALSPYQAVLVPAGAVTRLQAGPIASKSEADQVCAAVKAKGQGCLVVNP